MANRSLNPSGTLYLDGDIAFDHNVPISTGGFGDLWVGTSQPDGLKVAMKRLRIRGSGDDYERQLNETAGEAKVWRRLVNDHVLPFMGVLIQNGGFYLISPLLRNGSLPSYLLDHPDADRARLLQEVAEGLAYLHDQAVVHGDVKGENILVSDELHALLCDFGLSKFLDATGSTTKGISGTLRWQSPELMNGGHRTFESDVYAYGITIAEILTGKLPFHSIASDSGVIVAVLLQDERPQKGETPEYISEVYTALWDAAELSWQKHAEKRPTMEQLVGRVLALRPPSADTFSSEHTLLDDVAERLRLSPPTMPSELDNQTDHITPVLRRNPGVRNAGSRSYTKSFADRESLGASSFSKTKRNPLRILPADDGSPRFIEQMKRIEMLPRAKGAKLHAQRPDAPSTCLEGTRVGVLARVQMWVQDIESTTGKVFLVSGMAGTGKSTIAQTIAVQFENEGILGGTFFFGARGEMELRTADLVITTLAYQLSRFNAEFKLALADALEEDPDAPHELRVRQIQKLLVDPLQMVTRSQPILLVLDAVDECVQPDAEEILGLLLSAVAQVKNVPIKLLITSRPEPFIASTFSQYAIHSEIALHDIDAAIVTEDIRLYLQHELIRPSSRPLPSNSVIAKQDVETLIQRSGRLFVYAATAVRFIQDNRLFSPAAQLKTLLDSEKSKKSGALSYLDGLYSRILKSAEEILGGQISFELARDVLGAILLLKTSLALDALERLLALEPGYARAALYPFQSIIITPQEDHEPASIYHQSFSDFICDPSRCVDPRFYIDKATQEQKLACQCFEVMKTHLKRNIAKIPGNYVLELNDAVPNLAELVEKSFPAELRYACIHWAEHVGRSRTGDTGVLAALEDFITIRALWWLEALSLTGQWASSLVNLQNAHSWATHSHASDRVIDLLNDLQRFVLAHSPSISVAAQHIYYSALPYAPRDTKLWSIYGVQADLYAKLITGAPRQWSQSLTTLRSVDRILDVKISPDGSLIACCSYDGKVEIWDAVSGILVFNFAGHTQPVAMVNFSSDGKRLVSCSEDKTVRMWNPTSGKQVSVAQGHSAGVNAVVFSPDGVRLASASDDMTVRIWDKNLEIIHILEGHTAAVKSIDCSPNGTQLASGGQDNTLRLWDPISGVQLFVLDGHTKPIRCVTFSLNGLFLASASNDTTIRVWEAPSFSNVRVFQDHTDSVRVIAFSKDGSRLASGSNDRTMKTWDVATGTALHSGNSHTGFVVDVKFSPDGQRLVTGSGDHKVKLWDAMTGAELSTFADHGEYVNKVSFSPEGSRLASASADGTVRVWDTISSAPTHEYQGHLGAVTDITLSPDESRVASASIDSTIRIWDVASGETLVTLNGHTDAVKSVEFSPEGTEIVSGSDDKTVRLWEASSGKLLRTMTGHTASVYVVTYSPDGTLLVTGSQDKTVRTWDRKSGDQILVLEGHMGPINDVTFSLDGLHLASASSDKTVKIWDSASGNVTTLEGHTNEVYAVAFSPNGLRLASGADDKTVRLWDLSSGGGMNLVGHKGAIDWLVFSDDGSRLTSTGANRDTLVWDVVSGLCLWASTGSTAEKAGKVQVLSSTLQVPTQTHQAPLPDASTLAHELPDRIISYSDCPMDGPPPCEYLSGEILFEGGWVFRVSEAGLKNRLFFIPQELNVGASAVRKYPNLVVFGCEQGNVLFLDLSSQLAEQ